MNIEIDWDFFLKTNFFRRKGELGLPPSNLPPLAEKVIDDFLLLSEKDPALIARYGFKEIYRKTIELHQDEAQARKWLITQNDFFFGKSPLQYILANGSFSLLQFINERLGKK